MKKKKNKKVKIPTELTTGITVQLPQLPTVSGYFPPQEPKEMFTQSELQERWRKAYSLGFADGFKASREDY